MARSPSYPQFPLPKCIELLKLLYNSAHRATVDSQTAIEALGYSPRSGSGLGALSSLKQFSLISGRDESISITSLGLTLLEPLDEAEYQAAYKSAALSPGLFRELFEMFDESSPAEHVLRSMAVRKYEFTSTGAEKLFRSFSETISNIRVGTSGDGSEDIQTDKIDEGDVREENSYSSDEAGSGRSFDEDSAAEFADDRSVIKLQFPLSTECNALVLFDGPVTQRVIQKLISHLELSKDIYPSDN